MVSDFPSDESYDNKILIVNIGEKSYNIRIANTAKFKGHKLKTTTRFYVDGVEQEDDTICLIY